MVYCHLWGTPVDPHRPAIHQLVALVPEKRCLRKSGGDWESANAEVSFKISQGSTSSIPESNLWSTVLDSNKSIARFLKQVLAHAASNAPNGCVKIRDFKAIVVYGAKIHVINNLKYHGWTTGSCIPCIPHFENQQKKGLFSQYCDPVPVTISVTNDIFGCHFEPYPLVNDGKRLHNIWKDLPVSMGKSG